MRTILKPEPKLGPGDKFFQEFIAQSMNSNNKNSCSKRTSGFIIPKIHYLTKAFAGYFCPKNLFMIDGKNYCQIHHNEINTKRINGENPVSYNQ